MCKLKLSEISKLSIFLVVSICVKSSQSSVQNSCSNQDQNTFVCEGYKFLNKNVDRMIHQMKNLKSLQIIPGLNLEYDNSLNEVETQELLDKNSLLLKFFLFLKTHHLKVNFANLMNQKNSKDIEELLNQSGDEIIKSEARKKDKGGGGGGYMLMSAMMMGKMLAALGFGGVSALALKALGVSMMALMLSGILGLKKLSDGGHDGGHHIEYVTAEHHHKRRRRGTKVFKNINMI